MYRLVIWGILLWGMCISCTEYTPKPRGYFRIELPIPSYELFNVQDLPYSFHISRLAKVEFPPLGSPVRWINLSYPQLKVKLYCSYVPITSVSLKEVIEESRSLVLRQAKYPTQIKEQLYSNTEAAVYGALFLLDGESAAPIQFLLTDSISHFFRGTLYYDCIPNADSLAPVTQYLKQDIVELIQSFNWRK